MPSTQCAICFEKVKVTDETKLPNCEHAFHPECIEGWEKYNTCPVCKSIIHSDKKILKPQFYVEETVEEDKKFAVDLIRNEAREMFLDMLGLPSNFFQEGKTDDEHSSECYTVFCLKCNKSLCPEHSHIVNCDKCHDYFYCSLDCMLWDRPRHREECIVLKKEMEDQPSLGVEESLSDDEMDDY